MSQKTHLVFDIETIPDYEFYTPPETPAGTDKPMPPTYAHSPIVVGVLWLDHDYSFKRLGVVGEDRDERGMLEDFNIFVDKHKPLLVTYNGRAFDLPVIALRSMHYGLSMPWFYRGRDYRYRYSDDGHLDLCDFLSEHGATKHISLNASARLIGLPGKMDVDGSQVETLYKAGQLETIRKYCLADVVQTAFLFLRFRLLQGDFNLESYRKAAGNLYQSLVEDGRMGELLAQTDQNQLLLLGSGAQIEQ